MALIEVKVPQLSESVAEATLLQWHKKPGDAVARDENLIERSRQLGAELERELRRLADRHPVIGDVRGGHGLFAVLELVADRATREPLAPWPQTPPPLAALLQAALDEGVSFGARGNLILVAPPLVIDERDLANALALLDRLLARFFPA